MTEFIEKVKNALRSKAHAYQVVFQKGVMTDIVLKDLVKFCRAHQPTFHPDPRVHAMLEGRREVWLRIQEHLKLTSDELWELHEERKRGKG